MADIDLKSHGISVETILRNPSPARLYEEALRHEADTAVVSTGALVALSGDKTGRSPADKRIVRTPATEGDVWWEGMTPDPPARLVDWHGRPWEPGSSDKASNPNARYTTPASQCPIIDPDWENPDGVPVSAFIFGGRRSGVVPLVHEAFNWTHGVFLGSIMASETTAAAAGAVGKLRRDPFAMLPFCGYNMGDYFKHWLDMGRKLGKNTPRIFYVNWFRKDKEGNWLWPGFGENSRVLKWICERIEGKANAVETPIGLVPTRDSLDLNGLDIPETVMEELLTVRPEDWLSEIDPIREYYAQFGDRLPDVLNVEIDALEQRLQG